MKIEFGDLKLNELAKENLLTSINTNWISSGPMVKSFEQE